MGTAYNTSVGESPNTRNNIKGFHNKSTNRSHIDDKVNSSISL